MKDVHILYLLKCVFHVSHIFFFSFSLQAELLKVKLDRAAMLVDGLSDERIRWENTLASLTEWFDWLPSDCLIATGFVSYLGPFVSNYRQELISIWLKEVNLWTVLQNFLS